eukprot:6203188-Pleurochrysis_carterae.AAC.4
MLPTRQWSYAGKHGALSMAVSRDTRTHAQACAQATPHLYTCTHVSHRAPRARWPMHHITFTCVHIFQTCSLPDAHILKKPSRAMR